MSAILLYGKIKSRPNSKTIITLFKINRNIANFAVALKM